MKNSCVIVLVLLGLAQTAMLWPLEDFLVAEADFHPVEISSGRYARSAPTTKAPVAARGHHAAAVRDGSKVAHHPAGHKVSAVPAARANNAKKTKHQKRQVHPHKVAAAKDQKHQEKKHQVKKASAKRPLSAHTSSKNVKVHKAAAQHRK